MMAKYGACLLYLSVSVVGLAQAESLAISALGNLDLSYTQPQRVASYEGSPLPAQVEILPGNDYWISTPENI
ncbi:MAG: membrane fusion-like protein, partial [Shewanella sp.]